MMSSHGARVHVVSKQDVANHHTVPQNEKNLPPLEDGSIRVRTKFTCLTANNLTYANLGTALAWWDAYPIPSIVPEPYNDRSAWGIVPVWGYAVVLESNVSGIPSGGHLFGFWPSSTLPTDLQLKPTEPAGHFVATSANRKNVMALYNRYILAQPDLNFDGLSPDGLTQVARETFLRTAFMCAHLLASYILPSDNSPVHPLGMGLPWPPPSYDPRTTSIITLAAASTTARLITSQILHPHHSRTLCQNYLAITTAATNLPFPNAPNANAGKASYADIAAESTLTHLTTPTPPSRFLILDAGAPLPHARTLLTTLLTKFPNAAVTFIAIGTELAAITSIAASMPNAGIEVVQFNTSSAREAVIAQVGAREYFAELEAAWKSFASREGELDAFAVDMVDGVEGFDQAWTALCERGRAGVVCRF